MSRGYDTSASGSGNLPSSNIFGNISNLSKTLNDLATSLLRNRQAAGNFPAQGYLRQNVPTLAPNLKPAAAYSSWSTEGQMANEQLATRQPEFYGVQAGQANVPQRTSLLQQNTSSLASVLMDRLGSRLGGYTAVPAQAEEQAAYKPAAAAPKMGYVLGRQAAAVVGEKLRITDQSLGIGGRSLAAYAADQASAKLAAAAAPKPLLQSHTMQNQALAGKIVPNVPLSTAAPIYAQPLSKNVYKPVINVGTPIMNQNQSYGRTFPGGNSAAASDEQQQQQKSQSSSEVSSATVAMEVAKAAAAASKAAAAMQMQNMQQQQAAGPRQSSTNEAPAAFDSAAAFGYDGVGNEFAGQVFNRRQEHIFQGHQLQSTPTSTGADNNFNFNNSLVSDEDSALMRQVSEAVNILARTSQRGGGPSMSEMNSSSRAYMGASAAAGGRPPVEDQKEQEALKIKQKFYDLLQKYQKLRQNKPPVVGQQPAAAASRPSLMQEPPASQMAPSVPAQMNTAINEEMTRKSARPALMDTAVVRSALFEQQREMALRKHIEKVAAVQKAMTDAAPHVGIPGFCATIPTAEELQSFIAAPVASSTAAVFQQPPSSPVRLMAEPTKEELEEEERLREVENFPCVFYTSLPVTDTSSLPFPLNSTQRAVYKHFRTCLPNSLHTLDKTPDREEAVKCNAGHYKVFSQLKNFLCVDFCYETSIWDYDPRFEVDYLPGTKRGTAGRRDFVYRETYLDEENKWRKYTHVLENINKQKVTEKMIGAATGKQTSVSLIDFVINAKDEAEVKCVKMRTILLQEFEFPESAVTEDYCGICDDAFTNLMVSISHYNSVRHLKRVYDYCKQAAFNLVVKYNPNLQPSQCNQPWFINCIRSVLKKFKTKPDQWICDLCNVGLTGEQHARQHFAGAIHKKKAGEALTYKGMMAKMNAEARGTLENEYDHSDQCAEQEECGDNDYGEGYNEQAEDNDDQYYQNDGQYEEEGNEEVEVEHQPEWNNEENQQYDENEAAYGYGEESEPVYGDDNSYCNEGETGNVEEENYYEAEMGGDQQEDEDYYQGGETADEDTNNYWEKEDTATNYWQTEDTNYWDNAEPPAKKPKNTFGLFSANKIGSFQAPNFTPPIGYKASFG